MRIKNSNLSKNSTDSTGVKLGFELKGNPEAKITMINRGQEKGFKISSRKRECNNCGNSEKLNNTGGCLGYLIIKDSEGNIKFSDIVSLLTYHEGEAIPEYYFSIQEHTKKEIFLPLENRKESYRDERKAFYNYVDYSDFKLNSCQEVTMTYRFVCKSNLPCGFNREYIQEIDVQEIIKGSVAKEI